MNAMSLCNESASQLITHADGAPPSLGELRRAGQAEDQRIRNNESIIHRTAKTVLIGWLNQACRLAIAVEVHGLKGTAFERFVADIGIEHASAYELYKLNARRDAIILRCEREDQWPGWRSVLASLKPASPPSEPVAALAKTLQRKLDAERKAKNALAERVRKLSSTRESLKSGSRHRHAVPWQHASDDWRSPPALFNFLNRFCRDVAVCASRASKKCRIFFTKARDGLKQEWKSCQTRWMNPTYSKADLWAEKASEAAQAGAIVVGLLANRSATRWYRDYVVPYGLIAQLHGRVTFIQAGKPVSCEMSSAPFQSIVVVWPKEAGDRILKFCTSISAVLMAMP